MKDFICRLFFPPYQKPLLQEALSGFPLAVQHPRPCMAVTQSRNCSLKPQLRVCVCVYACVRLFAFVPHLLVEDLLWSPPKGKKNLAVYPPASQTAGNCKSIERLSTLLRVRQTMFCPLCQKTFRRRRRRGFDSIGWQDEHSSMAWLGEILPTLLEKR